MRQPRQRVKRAIIHKTDTFLLGLCFCWQACKRCKDCNVGFCFLLTGVQRTQRLQTFFLLLGAPGKPKKQKNRKTKQNEKQNKHKNDKHNKKTKTKPEKRQEPQEHHEPIGLDSNQHLTNDNNQQLTTAAIVGNNNCNLMANVGKCASKKTAKLQQCCATFTAKGNPPQTTINNCSNCWQQQLLIDNKCRQMYTENKMQNSSNVTLHLQRLEIVKTTFNSCSQCPMSANGEWQQQLLIDNKCRQMYTDKNAK